MKEKRPITNPIERAREIILKAIRLEHCYWHPCTESYASCMCRRQAANAIAALAEEGLYIVPREPTDRLCEAMVNCIDDPYWTVADMYRAMIAAALNSKEKE